MHESENQCNEGAFDASDSRPACDPNDYDPQKLCQRVKQPVTMQRGAIQRAASRVSTSAWPVVRSMTFFDIQASAPAASSTR